jgi:hypothetical protein
MEEAIINRILKEGYEEIKQHKYKRERNELNYGQYIRVGYRYFKKKKDNLMEHLDGDGEWSFEPLDDNYKNVITKLKYNFYGKYDFFISTTNNNFNIIWRKKKNE